MAKAWTSLAVQWLRYCTSPIGDADLIPGGKSRGQNIGAKKRVMAKVYWAWVIFQALWSECNPVRRGSIISPILQKGKLRLISLSAQCACRILVPQQGLYPGPQQWKHRALTTRLPGNSQKSKRRVRKLKDLPKATNNARIQHLTDPRAHVLNLCVSGSQISTCILEFPGKK